MIEYRFAVMIKIGWTCSFLTYLDLSFSLKDPDFYSEENQFLCGGPGDAPWNYLNVTLLRQSCASLEIG